MSKKSSRREFLSLAALAAGGLVLTACGQDSIPGQTTAASGVAATTAAGSSTTAASGVATTAAGSTTAVTTTVRSTTAAATAAPVASGSGVVRIAISRAPTALDGVGGGVQSTNASLQMYDALVELDPKLQPRAALAESWEVSRDG